MSNSETSDKPQNILELFSFDLTKFFADNDYCEIESKDAEGVFMVEFEKEFPLAELDLFESVIFRLFNDKSNITASNHINVTLPANPRHITESKVKKLVDAIYNIYGYDDDRRGLWNDSDSTSFKDKDLERQWTIGSGKRVYAIKLSYTDKHGLYLKIFFFNRLLESIKFGNVQSYH